MISGKHFGLSLILSIILISVILVIPAPAQQSDPGLVDSSEGEIEDFHEDSMMEIDFYSLEELLSKEVEVASLFLEDEFVVGSTVASIDAEQWTRMGARRLFDALINEMGLMLYPTYGGTTGISIRGYTTSTSPARGISLLIDGIPINGLVNKTALYQVSNWELGTLNAIEMIKGPGSAIYGEDAFHGVLLLKTFESIKNHYSFEVAGAYPFYTDGSLKVSHGLLDGKLRIDLSAGGSFQDDQEIENEYESGATLAWTPGSPGVYDYPAGKNTRKDKYKSGSGVLKISLYPTTKFKIRLGGYANAWKADDFPGIGLYGPADFQDGETKIYIGSLSASYKLPEQVSVKVCGFYWNFVIDHHIVFGVEHGTTEATANCPYNPESRYGANVIMKQPDNPLNIQWVVGYSYNKIKIADNIKSDFRNLETGHVIMASDLYYTGYSRAINSFFCQAKWEAIHKSLFLIAGGRFDDYTDSGEQVSPRLGIIYLPVNSVSLKLLYGKAFRALSGAELKGWDMYSNDPNIQPETLDCYEAVMIYKGKRIKVNLNGYYSEWHDTVGHFNYIYQNLGESRSWGGELNVIHELDPAALEVGFAYVRSIKVLDGNSFGFFDILNKDSKTEIEYHAFPRYSFHAGIMYDAPWSLKLYLNNRMYMKMKEDPSAVSEDLPVYWRMDLDVSRVLAQRLELHLNIRNLLNRENRIPGIWHNSSDYTPYDSNGIPEGGLSVLLRAEYRL